MALSANTLPSIVPSRAVPVDVALQFCEDQTIASTGYLTNVLGSGNMSFGPGRKEGYWVLDISALEVASGDEVYQFFLLGSNDSSWTNGAVEILASRDFAAATGDRLVPTICPASDTVPPTGLTSDRFVIPFSNQMGRFVFQYLRARVIIAGTIATGVTVSSWITPDCD